MRSPLEPPLVELTNETWTEFVNAGITIPTDPGAAAEIAAEVPTDTAWAKQQAAQRGTGGDQMDKLIQLALGAPGFGELLRIFRRHPKDTATFEHGLRKNKLETLWDAYLEELQIERLDPAVIALGIVRDTIPDPGLQTGAHSTEGSDIEQGPQFAGDVLAEFFAGGITPDRARVMVDNIGLPMPPVRAANAYFRKIINKASYYLSVAQSDSRPAWADAILEEARQILTAHDWVELHLRGYIDQQAMYDGVSLHGMSPEDADRLFRVLGRPLTAHQITTGLARGAKFNPLPGELTDPYEAAAHESNVKPSYYALWIANRYNYPSLFQLNNLVKGNAISADVARDWAAKDGYAPEVLDAMHTFWAAEEAKAGGTTGTKPKTYTYSNLHQAWRTGIFTDAQALAELEALGYPSAKAQTLLSIWKAAPPTSGVPA